ncbi:MAG: GTPase [Pseudomarimonas sp.]
MSPTDKAAPPRMSQHIRWVLALAVVVGLLVALNALVGLVDSTVTLWQRLQLLPVWVNALFAVAAAGLVAASGWLVWRLLKPRRARVAVVASIDRPRIEQRLAALPPTEQSLAGELIELDRRRVADVVQIALYGDVSSGKSSLLKALVSDAAPVIAASGGSTRQVEHARTTLADGRTLQIADMPGLNEPTGEARAAMARDEAARAHALVYVADGDLTRSQDTELRALLQSGRPLLLALNKSDRYRDDERETVLKRLRERYPGPQVRVVAISAGHVESVLREYPDGRTQTVEREQPARIEALLSALATIAKIGAVSLEPARETATLIRLDQRLTASEIEHRTAAADACITRYTRRAVVGAMAAVAPGTDLIIQGALATAMLGELCGLHGLKARDIDLDGLLSRIGMTARSTTAITLAIAGNALKAFPGAGTLGGGLVHALAYGLLFDALGRAVSMSLADARAFDREATLSAFANELAKPSGERLRLLAGMAWDIARGRPEDDAGRRSKANDAH